MHGPSQSGPSEESSPPGPSRSLVEAPLACPGGELTRARERESEGARGSARASGNSLFAEFPTRVPHQGPPGPRRERASEATPCRAAGQAWGAAARGSSRRPGPGRGWVGPKGARRGRAESAEPLRGPAQTAGWAGPWGRCFRFEGARKLSPVFVGDVLTTSSSRVGGRPFGRGRPRGRAWGARAARPCDGFTRAFCPCAGFTFSLSLRGFHSPLSPAFTEKGPGSLALRMPAFQVHGGKRRGPDPVLARASQPFLVWDLRPRPQTGDKRPSRQAAREAAGG